MVTLGFDPDLPAIARRELNQTAGTDRMSLYMLRALQQFGFLALGIQILIRIYELRNGFLQPSHFRKQVVQLQGYVHNS